MNQIEDGWHWTEWSCELVGTAVVILCGLSAVCLDFGPHSPITPVIPSHSLRLLLTGTIFAGTGSLVTISPLGRRSGAHLNPAVTVAFWCRRHLHVGEVAGYVTSQVIGALFGATAVRLLWGSTASAVHLGVTQPGNGLDALGAAGVEALMTALLVGTILVMVSFRRSARWTPLVLWPLIAILVWQGAPWTGTSLNPARSLAPALVLPETGSLWAYIVGPLLGALLAVGIYALVGRAETLTAKLFHDSRYPSPMASTLKALPAHSGVSRRRGLLRSR